MPREEIPVDQETFDRVLQEGLAERTYGRVAESRT